MDKPVRIGIVGVQHFHVFDFLQTFSDRDDVELVGVAEGELDRRARLRRARELPEFDDLETLIHETRPDALALYNKPSDRAEVIRRCAEQGIHVWTDKPIATTLEDLDGVEQALAGCDIALMVTVAGTYSPRTHALKQLLGGGELGKLAQFVSISSHRFVLPQELDWKRPAWAGDWRGSGGLIAEMAIHGISEFRRLVDSPIVSISAQQGNARFPSLPHFQDHCVVLLRAKSGAQGIIQSTWLTPGEEPSHGRFATFVVAAKGYVEIVSGGIAHGLQARQDRAHAIIASDDAPPRTFEPGPGLGRSAADDFLDQVRSGKPPLVPREFFLESMRVALLAREAAQRDETIHCD